ncbi:MAG: DUF4347 domain-containing protein, partial [Alkalinema sp. RL_2_19]|nr:DUF4347 domain-containing protein [Alkalinema sp. RL_2_19]
LSENADILIYGCNFAQGESGERAADTLAQLTGADIAASDDLTGATDLGGDAELEVHKGVVEAATLFTQDDFNRFNTSLNLAPVATDTDATAVNLRSGNSQIAEVGPAGISVKRDRLTQVGIGQVRSVIS